MSQICWATALDLEEMLDSFKAQKKKRRLLSRSLSQTRQKCLVSGDSRWWKANVNIIPISMCVSTAGTGRERLLGGNVANFKYVFIQAIISCINIYLQLVYGIAAPWNNASPACYFLFVRLKLTDRRTCCSHIWSSVVESARVTEAVGKWASLTEEMCAMFDYITTNRQRGTSIRSLLFAFSDAVAGRVGPQICSVVRTLSICLWDSIYNSGCR